MTTPLNLYELPAMRTITGPAIRPGGLTLTDRAMDICRLAPDMRVLDVGCGCGVTVAHLRQRYGLRAIGMDLSRKLLAEADIALNRLPLIQGRGETLPISSESVTAVFCECVLSLMEDPEIALLEWRRVSASNGFLVLSDLYAREGGEEKQSSLPVRCCLSGAVGRQLLFQRVREAGFEIVRFEDHTYLLKQLAAQLVWTYGSMEAFWSQWGGGGGKANASTSGRPGYYLLIARKKGDRHG